MLYMATYAKVAITTNERRRAGHREVDSGTDTERERERS